MEKWKLIGIGLSGWYAKRKDFYRSSFSSDIQTLEHFIREAEEGAVVYDASNANVNNFINFLSRAPVIDFDMIGKEYEQFKDTSINKLGGFGEFDLVSLDLYLNLMREYVPGVRFGKIINGKLVWEDGKKYLPK